MKLFSFICTIIFSCSLFAQDLHNISGDAAIACKGKFDIGHGLKEYQFEVAIVGKKSDHGNQFPVYVFLDGKRYVDDGADFFKSNKNLVFQMQFDVMTPTQVLVVKDAGEIDFKQRNYNNGHSFKTPGYFVHFGKKYALACEVYFE